MNPDSTDTVTNSVPTLTKNHGISEHRRPGCLDTGRDVCSGTHYTAG